MRIYLHDYGRYPFIGQLARELASRGHVVALAGSGGDSRRAEDESGHGVEVRLILPGVPIPKSSFLRRARHEIAHGKAVCRDLEQFRPDVVVSANAPILAQKRISAWCCRRSVPMIYWLQDLLGAGAEHLLGEKFGVVGRQIGRRLARLESRLLRQADHVIAISESFGIPGMTVLPNWAPLGETPVRDRGNEWSRRHGLLDLKTVMYSGTLGLKHDPHALLNLARSMADDEKLVVVAEGAGAEVLRNAPDPHLLLLPLQPYADLPNVLGSADVLLATLLPEAGAYCVPSKVLTYLCAARPVVLYAPVDNDASRMIADSGAGCVVEPGDVEGLKRVVRELLQDKEKRASAAGKARAVAESRFDIKQIGDRFEEVIVDVARNGSGKNVPTMDKMGAANEG